MSNDERNKCYFEMNNDMLILNWALFFILIKRNHFWKYQLKNVLLYILMSPCTKLVFVTIFLCLKSCGKGGALKLQYICNISKMKSTLMSFCNTCIGVINNWTSHYSEFHSNLRFTFLKSSFLERYYRSLKTRLGVFYCS